MPLFFLYHSCWDIYKDLFNAEDFETLVTETLEKRNVKKYAKENNLKINRSYTVEVYPAKDMQYPEMYILTPIK